MALVFFHTEPRRIFRGKLVKKSPYGHTFGAPVDYKGLVPSRREPPVHLLFRLNTADPSVGVQLREVEWLPLLCAIRYGACNLGYHVVSDEAVKILYQSERKAWDNFPFADYPEKLPVRPIAFKEAAYDPGKVEDGLLYAGVFGYGALSPRQYAKLVRHVEKENLPEMLGWESAEAFLELDSGEKARTRRGI